MYCTNDGYTHLWICSECRIAATNGDFSGLDFSYEPEEADRRMAAITAGMEDLGPSLASHWDSEDDRDAHIEHSIDPCECCGESFHGDRWHFVVTE